VDRSKREERRDLGEAASCLTKIDNSTILDRVQLNFYSLSFAALSTTGVSSTFMDSRKLLHLLIRDD
jgi:hypothetical protein